VINDFILILYSKFGLAGFNGRMFRLMVRQLHHWYPEATINVLTNVDLPPLRNVVPIYNPDLPNSWEAKLSIYGLLDKPAMYLDLDLVLFKPFSEHDLLTPYDFRLYWSFGNWIFPYPHYNSAVVWVKRPNKATVKEMLDIYHKEGFNKSGPPWHANDEFALSRWCYLRRWHMNTVERRVNVPKAVAGYNVHEFQSVHYQLKAKYQTFLPDLATVLPLKIN
jgi:hypothetical protein